MRADAVRKKFLNFFASKGHKIIASDSLVPKADPTVLFTSAGMNQFKNQFLGHITDFRRATTCQKCLRTDDLEKVGKTPFHHTFFEMLGNFSFGDYFKEEAITWAWEFLTQELLIPAEKLWASVYIEDNEALEIWQEKIKLPSERILVLSDKDNFWPSEAKTKGPNGPCGPCSEIFFDYGTQCGCRKDTCSPVCVCGRFTEVWNLVFTQFERKEGGSLAALPSRNIDTGMGLERLCAVLENVNSNFETDLFKPIIEAIKKEASLLGGKFNNRDNEFTVKALADHTRAIAFAISDGILPSNEERGYVIRKLIRRCCMLYRQVDINKPFIYKIIPIVALAMKEPYPELLKRQESISGIIKKEEESFAQILVEYVPLMEKEMQRLEKELAHKKDELAQELARLKFKAYDTYGLPAEITSAAAQKKKLSIDEELFEKLMEEQKTRSRDTSSMVGDVFSGGTLAINLAPSEFLGYQLFESDARILKIFKDNQEVNEIKAGDIAKIILDKTPFYAESGGQSGDTGLILRGDNKIEVLNTQAQEKNIIHAGNVKGGIFKTGDQVKASVNKSRRLSIARNHTATHLLQSALRKVLGAHVQQQGSFVGEDRLRFDFSHFKALEKEEIDRIEEIVNDFILQNDSLEVKTMPLQEAKAEGALAFFAEKYDETVRMVKIGDYSTELCGGTHLNHTGEIGLFKIISESSVAQGVRRIEATTGSFAYKLSKQKEEVLTELSRLLKTEPGNIASRIDKQLGRIKELEKETAALKLKFFAESLDAIMQKSPDLSGVKIIVQKIDNADNELLRQMADVIKTKASSAVIVLGATHEGKVFITVGLTQDLVKRGIDAADILKEICQIVSAKGGGKPHLAQAGGTDAARLGEALEKAALIIRGKINR